jgi:hypothetical protein
MKCARYGYKPHSCIKKVAKRVKTVMDNRQSQDQGYFRGINQW